MTIGVRLTGGLGNQMFQYAAARSLAARHRTMVALDLSWFDQLHCDTHRAYALDAFVGPSASPKCALPGGITARERSFSFDPTVEELPDRSILAGYFQSEQYFCEHAEVIREELSFRDRPDRGNRAILGLIGTCESVAVHVRRGDYASDPVTHEHHGLIPLDYYREAAEEIMSRVRAPKFFVFSDDPLWCRRSLSFLREGVVVDHNAAEDGTQDLRLMAACRHHVIANSTFSWWGAWLASHAGQVVVAPRRWFAGASHDAADVCPPRWLRR